VRNNLNSRGAYFPIRTPLAIYRVSQLQSGWEWILIGPRLIVPWHMSWSWVLKGRGRSGPNDILWHWSYVQPNFWLKNDSNFNSHNKITNFILSHNPLDFYLLTHENFAPPYTSPYLAHNLLNYGRLYSNSLHRNSQHMEVSPTLGLQKCHADILHW